MNRDESIVSDFACWAVAAVFVFGLAVLAVRLKEVQIEDAADYGYANVRQSVRRVQTDGDRGRIIDRNGVVLADNRRSISIVCNGGRSLPAHGAGYPPAYKPVAGDAAGGVARHR